MHERGKKIMATVSREPSKRLTSLDAFRGATIAGMVLVNTPGSWQYVYPQLRHAAWHGWTFTDWIFPFFLFIVGVAMTFSTAKRVEAGANTRQLMMHVIRRSVIIFAIGLFLNGFPFWLGPSFSWETFRIPGVLQRIAVCYLVAGVLLLKTTSRTQLMWAVILPVIYWFLVKLVPVPGYGAGVLEPTGNLLWYIDSNMLNGHTWVWAPAKGFDPEGILSTLTAISTTLIGVMTGHWLRSQRSREEKTVWMFVAGNVLLLVGVILDTGIPINKNLWSPAFVTFMGGWGLICLATFYWVIDVKGFTRWATPFVILGMNAIAIYVLSELIAIVLLTIPGTQPDGSPGSLYGTIFNVVFMPLASPTNASLFFAIAYVLLMILISWFMWKRRWFIKI